jgi:hypothetical protein
MHGHFLSKNILASQAVAFAQQKYFGITSSIIMNNDGHNLNSK